MADYTNLVSLLERMMEAVAQHAAHLLAPIISGLLGEAGGESEELEDSVRVGRLAVLAGAAEHGPAGAGGDPSPLYSALSQACADSLPLARRLALRGLSCPPLDRRRRSRRL